MSGGHEREYPHVAPDIPPWVFGRIDRAGDRHLGLGPHIAVIDRDVAVVVHAENAPARDVGLIVDEGALLKGFERVLDLPQALIDRVRQLRPNATRCTSRPIAPAQTRY